MSLSDSRHVQFNSNSVNLRPARVTSLLLRLLSLPGLLSTLAAFPLARADEIAAFNTTIQPYLQQYCIECHNQQQAKGELNLARFQNPQDIISNFRRWQAVIEFVEGGEMPPAESRQPSLEESRDLVNAVRTILISEARKNAGDPGLVLPRRLTNTEY
ncbi:MAG: c-type cytochrome domain-containing protein, partial [Planctomyces sp.]